MPLSRSTDYLAHPPCVRLQISTAKDTSDPPGTDNTVSLSMPNIREAVSESKDTLSNIKKEISTVSNLKLFSTKQSLNILTNENQCKLIYKKLSKLKSTIKYKLNYEFDNSLLNRTEIQIEVKKTLKAKTKVNVFIRINVFVQSNVDYYVFLRQRVNVRQLICTLDSEREIR